MMDYRPNGFPPISYGAGLAREWLRKNPEHNFTRAALIHNNNMLFSMLDSVIKLLRPTRVTVQFFNDETKAIDWLLSDS
jgi:hypothetical protein